MSVRDEAFEVARRLTNAPAEQRFDLFFELIRQTKIPYLACGSKVDRRQHLLDTYEALYILGGASLPLAVGLTMHAYATSAIATGPEGIDRSILAELAERRLLLAVGSVGDNRGRNDTIQIPEDGLAYGTTLFQSMASKADRVLFAAEREGSLGLYVADLHAEEVTVGDRLFDGPLADADTRSVAFKAAGYQTIATEPGAVDGMMDYGTAWFESLVSAAYLGAAARCIDAARTFARSMRLAQVDGVQVEFGRIAIELRSALALVQNVARNIDDLMEMSEAAAVAKHRGTRVAEEIVTWCRRFIGTRAMAAGNIVGTVSQQIMYGPLHPKVSAVYERDLGEAILSTESFASLMPKL